MHVIRWATALLPLLTLAPSALAQDNNYWTLQYGNQARLLGGAVIGSASDLSAVYYNPGRLALAERFELVIAGNVVEFTATDLDAAGRERNSGKARFSLSPSLFAGELKFGFLGKGRLAYSFMARQYSELRLAAAFLEGGGGGGNFTADVVKLDHRLAEYWAGFSYATRVGDDIGVGVSMYVTPRSHRTSVDVQEAFLAAGMPAVGYRSVGYEYSHWGLLWKLGGSTRLGDWDVGLTVTTPRIKLYGKGDVYDARAGIDRSDPDVDLIDIHVVPDLAARYKSPWSIAAGASRTFGANSIHAGAEWFAPISEYTVLDAPPQAPQYGGVQPESADLVGGSGHVINFAVGFQRRENDKLRWYASMHSDYAAERPEGTNLSFTDWNLWHVGGGASFTIGTTDVTLGAIYATGSKAIAGQFENVVQSRLHRVTLILGFNLPFGSPQAI